ncbi:MAG: DUF2000 family protein [Chloroflexia bacterium]|nr:DUF2000 family protein [Chloroflexia bacterium]
MDQDAPGADTAAPMFDTKLVVVLRDDLPTWQKINATLFLVSGIVATAPETVGEPYADASGGRYLPMFRQPGLVFAATRDELRRAFDRATQRGVEFAVFTDDLFATTHDAANRAAVRARSQEDLPLAGIAFRTDRRVADKVVKGLKFHP